VSHAGLVPLLELAERTGLSQLLTEHVRFVDERVKSGAANATPKLTSIVAGMAAGADSISEGLRGAGQSAAVAPRHHDAVPKRLGGETHRLTVPRTGEWTPMPFPQNVFTLDVYPTPSSPRHAVSLGMTVNYMLSITYSYADDYGVGTHTVTHRPAASPSDTTSTRSCRDSRAQSLRRTDTVVASGPFRHRRGRRRGGGVPRSLPNLRQAPRSAPRSTTLASRR
jgi:hypothetical protein